MTKIKCSAIVHCEDFIILVRQVDSKVWQVPKVELPENDEPIHCIRNCVLQQTGYRPLQTNLFRIQSKAKTLKNGSCVNFIFGCHIEPVQLLQPTHEVGCFTPNQILKLANDNKLQDTILLRLIGSFKAFAKSQEPIL